MADKIIKDPILNRPYDEPTRHFEFDVDGITDRIAERRRPSSYFVPVPRSRKGGRQLLAVELLNRALKRHRANTSALWGAKLPYYPLPPTCGLPIWSRQRAGVAQA